MKRLLTTALIAMTLSTAAMAEDIVCKYLGGAYRPVSPLAQDIAKELDLKSCQGARFKAVAAQLGKTIIKQKATKAEKEAYLKQMDTGIKLDSFKTR